MAENKITESFVEDVLRNVYDPEIGLNIVDLGLIYSITISVNHINIIMTLTTEFCPMGGVIIEEIEYNIKNAFPEYTLTIELVFEPRWTQELINEQGKAFLGLK